MEHQGRTAIVTGGSKGIGAACVEIFVREGAQVLILDVDEENGNCWKRNQKEKCILFAAMLRRNNR